VVNKTDLARYVGVDVEVMVRDAEHAREGRPVLALSRTDAGSVATLIRWVRETLAAFRADGFVPVDPGPMAPHAHPAGAEHMHRNGTVHAH
jgi:urease accessory protein